jgi:hypothetical protein
MRKATALISVGMVLLAVPSQASPQAIIDRAIRSEHVRS